MISHYIPWHKQHTLPAKPSSAITMQSPLVAHGGGVYVARFASETTDYAVSTRSHYYYSLRMFVSDGGADMSGENERCGHKDGSICADSRVVHVFTHRECVTRLREVCVCVSRRVRYAIYDMKRTPPNYALCAAFYNRPARRGRIVVVLCGVKHIHYAHTHQHTYTPTHIQPHTHMFRTVGMPCSVSMAL